MSPTPTPSRDQIIASAIRAGKIAADRRDEYRRMYDADPKAIRNLLTASVEQGGLMPGIVLAADDYPAEWLGKPTGGGTITGDA